jgi:hypothetical protein
VSYQFNPENVESRAQQAMQRLTNKWVEGVPGEAYISESRKASNERKDEDRGKVRPAPTYKTGVILIARGGSVKAIDESVPKTICKAVRNVKAGKTVGGELPQDLFNAIKAAWEAEKKADPGIMESLNSIFLYKVKKGRVSAFKAVSFGGLTENDVQLSAKVIRSLFAVAGASEIFTAKALNGLIKIEGKTVREWLKANPEPKAEPEAIKAIKVKGKSKGKVKAVKAVKAESLPVAVNQ